MFSIGHIQPVSDVAFPRPHARSDGLVALRELTFMMETVSQRSVFFWELLGCDWKIPWSTHAFSLKRGRSFRFVRIFSL